MPQRGLAANQRLTKWFIDDDPHTIIPHRRVRENVPGGGYRMVEQGPRAEQTVKFVYKGSASSFAGAEGLQVTTDGQEYRFDFTIVAMFDADIEQNDWFEDDKGQRWEIKSEIPSNDYERRFGVSAYGQKVTGG
jgi:hypothetical protein